MKLLAKYSRILLLVSAFAAVARANPTVQNSDFIPDNTRTAFNGFEAIPNDGTFYTGGNGPYVEDGIQVQQVNGHGADDIWIGYNYWSGASGRVWYPNGGDSGYTSISLSGGANFQDVGFNFGTGNSGVTSILYSLYEGGSLVTSGTAPLSTSSTNYLGFSGGGFDTIHVRDNLSDSNGPVENGSYQALAIDNIETQGSSVPDQGCTLTLLACAVTGLFAMRRRLAV